MSEKPAGMEWDDFIEASVRKAMSEGEFRDLPGAGRPIKGLDEPYREDWWINSLLKRENLSLQPPGLKVRADVERTMGRIGRLGSEAAVRREIAALNARIAGINASVISGPSTSVGMLDPDVVVARWQALRRGEPPQ